MNRTLSILSFAFLFALSFAHGSGSQNRGRNPSAAEQRPTTLKQRGHAKVFGKIRSGQSKLTELTGTGDRIVIHQPDLYDISPPESPLEFLTTEGCLADAVVVGAFVDEVSALTEGETFIFTDLTLNVERVLKNSSLAPLAVGQAVTVTRPGGELRLANRTVRAELPLFRPFRVGGRYLLYLKFLPQTGDYRASGKGSFELRGERALKLTPDLLWNESKRKVEQTSTLLALAEKSVGGPCK